MRASTFLSIAGVVAVFFGLFELIAPLALARLYGVDLSDPAFLHVTRLLGSSTLALGVIAWMVRNADFVRMQPVLVGIAAGTVTGLLASLHRVLAGGPPMNWLNVVIYLGLAIGCFYCLSKRNDPEPAAGKLA
jgi:hypothetical protein